MLHDDGGISVLVSSLRGPPCWRGLHFEGAVLKDIINAEVRRSQVVDFYLRPGADLWRPLEGLGTFKDCDLGVQC